jgi:hypothetical protein
MRQHSFRSAQRRTGCSYAVYMHFSLQSLIAEVFRRSFGKNDKCYKTSIGNICHQAPGPTNREIYLADLTAVYKKYRHKRLKHIVLSLAHRQSQCSSRIFITAVIYIHFYVIFTCTSINIYFIWLGEQCCCYLYSNMLYILSLQ